LVFCKSARPNKSDASPLTQEITALTFFPPDCHPVRIGTEEQSGYYFIIRDFVLSSGPGLLDNAGELL
jgi:hypothetical protein